MVVVAWYWFPYICLLPTFVSHYIWDVWVIWAMVRCGQGPEDQTLQTLVQPWHSQLTPLSGIQELLHTHDLVLGFIKIEI